MQPQATHTKSNGASVTLEELVGLRISARGLQLNSKKRVATSLYGGHLSALRGRGIDFDEVRVYQAGDDIRTMDWRVTARTGEPHIKLYHEERERPVFLVIDYNPNMYFGTRVAFKSVIAARAAALLGWAAINNGDRVGGIIFSGNQHIECRPQGRQQGILPLLKQLSDIKAPLAKRADGDAFAQALLRLRHVTTPGSLIFLLSDFYYVNKEAERQLRLLSQHNQMVACAIHDQLELAPPPPNRYSVTDGQQQLIIDTQNKTFCDDYRREFLKRQQHLKLILAQRQIPLIELMTHDNIVERLTRCFNQTTLRDVS